jgi:xanthine dehydrogenase/oxidase
MGQGVNTKMAQIAARAFNIPMSSVHVGDCSVDKVPNTPPTAASVGADLNGMAVLDGCEQIIERLKPLREKYPKAAFPELCELAFKARISLSAEGYYSTPKGAVYDWKMDTTDNTKRGEVFNYYVFGVACSEVEIDVLTGMWRVRVADLLMDCGDTLNPAIDIGQVESSFLQGQGWLTSEELIWGDAEHPQVPPGTLLNGSPHGYKVPGPMDVPRDFRVRLLAGCPNPNAVHSSKAVGEPPFFLSASVYFALKDAIVAARKEKGFTGYHKVDSPLTVERIRIACRDHLTALALGKDEEYQVPGSF